MLKGVFKLPLRQTTGMIASFLGMAGLDWPVPDFSTLSRRQKTLLVELLGQIPHEQDIASVSADGAFDTRVCHEAIAARVACVIIPARCNAKAWPGDNAGRCAPK